MKTAIIGAGLMGHALALVHALGGCRVRLQDNEEAARNRAPALIDTALATLAEGAAIETSEAAEAAKRIETVADIAEAVRDAELVVEAVTENRDIKRDVYAGIDSAAPADAILASNTSHLDVFPLMPAGRQARCLITHWYTPPYIVDLVDLAPGPETTPEVMETMRALYNATLAAGKVRHTATACELLSYLSNLSRVILEPAQNNNIMRQPAWLGGHHSSTY